VSQSSLKPTPGKDLNLQNTAAAVVKSLAQTPQIHINSNLGQGGSTASQQQLQKMRLRLSQIGRRQATTANGTATVYKINAPKFISQKHRTSMVVPKGTTAVDLEQQ
jgi:hypothetical protein